MTAAVSAPSVTDTAGAPPRWKDSARALITPCPRPLWRPFWLIIAAAFALRLLAAIYGHWYWRADEIFQYLEQAHRVIFGYGFIPWEIRYDARSWLTAGVVMPPLALAKWLGLEDPRVYATMVNSWNALLSLAIPVCAYLISRRLLGEKSARWALLFTCFWYEFIILAPRALSEIYATLLFLAALAAGAGGSRRRWILAGFLMGAAIAFRPHYAPAAAAAGLLWLWLLPRHLSAAAVTGGSVALLGWGLLDFITLGGWWVSLVNYMEYVPVLWPVYADSPLPFYTYHPLYFTAASFGLYPLIILPALLLFRRLWFPLLICLSLSVFFFYPAHYSNLFILLPVLWIMISEILSAAYRRSKLPGRIGLALIILISAAGAGGALPGLRYFYYTDNFFSVTPAFDAAYKAHHRIEEKDNTVLVWAVRRGLLAHGGFYTLHRNIPVFYLYDRHIHDRHHQHIWETANVPLEDFATHVIAAPGFKNPAFEAQPLTPELNLYINKQTPSYPAAARWRYDYMNPTLETEKLLPPRDYTPYNPDL